MNFERGTDVKDQIGIGISDKILEVGYVIFHIKCLEAGKPRLGNPIYDFKLDTKRDILESTKCLLSLLETNPLPFEKIQQVAHFRNRYEKRKFNQSIKEGRIPTLLLEVGAMDDMMKRVEGGMEYLKFQGEIFPIGTAPHVISVSSSKNFFQRFRSWIFNTI